ncbi:cell surface A33 antigen-like [Acanthopagrus latus]|uniref:cell surface A33 antigen-like n=1 Tax=Acanthopagrus latus TaxID=8177 RepID=UPI00187C880C|nr:cell surface A33 antigen-like [Acanthopagrus latus]
MATKRLLGWQKLFLILTVLPCCRSLQVSIPQQEYEVARGEDITMTCSFTPARPISNIMVLTWEAYINEEMKVVATYYLRDTIDIAPAYENRAALVVDLDKQVSTLRLTKVTIQDSRRFQCSVMIPGDDEGTTSATTSLLVLVPPSPPICKVQGTAEYFHNITLTCKSEEGSPTPVTEWKSYSVENIPRSFPPKATEKDGALSLFNISRETSGFFICTSTNQIGSASCNLTLSVMPGSMNIGSTAAILGGILAGVVALGIIIYCCCCKKGKKDKNPEGSPEEVNYIRDAPETGEPYKDDKSNSKTKQLTEYFDQDIAPQNNYSVGKAGHTDDDQNSYISGKERHDGKGSDIDSQRYQGDQRDHYQGSRDRLDDQRDRSRGSRDRLDDRDRYGGSRDRLDERDRYGGSRDRLDERDRYGGSRDRLDERDRYRGSRDRLDERDRYGGSRDRLDERDHYRGSRDRLDEQRVRYGGSRDRLDDHGDSYRSSRDRLDYADDVYRD